MNKFIIQRTNDKKFVAPSGSKLSYTSYLQKARVYSSLEEAQKEICKENEVIIRLEYIL